jgi:hypothetical protein
MLEGGFGRGKKTTIVEFQQQQEIYDKMIKNANFYRQPDGGVYKNKVWSRREYK